MSANPTPATKTDWPSLFNGVQKAANIPDVSGVDRDQLSVTVRGMYVSLPDAVKQITAPAGTASGATVDIPDGTVLQIYCDVLAIPANYNLTLDGTALFVAARRIEANTGAVISLNCHRTDISTVAIFAQEIQGQINALVMTSADEDAPGTSYVIDSVTPTGEQISKQGREAQDGIEDPQLGSGSPFELSLVSIFQFATVVAATRPDIAKSMFQWIKQSTADLPAVSDLNAQSASMLVRLDTDVTFVPYLSQDIYKDAGDAFLGAAAAYEDQYNRFTDKTADINARLDLANLMLSGQTDSSTYVGKLIDLANDNLESARKAVDAAEAQFHSQQNRVDEAQVTFQSGLAEWVYDKTVEAAFKICGAILEFGACIGEMAATGGASAASGGAGPGEAAKVAQSVEKASKAAGEASSAMEKAIKAIAKLTETLKKTYEIAVKLAEDQSLADTTKPDDSPGTDDSEGDPIAAWSVFKLHANEALRTAINSSPEVPGAADYQVEIDTLVVYAQSLASSRLSYIKVSQDLVRLKLQQEMAEKQQARLENYVKELQASKAPNLAMTQMFFQRYVDMKRWLFLSMDDYAAAFKYWALREASPTPVLTSNVADFKRAMANATNDYDQALASFSPPPQKAENLSCTIDDPRVLASLKETGQASWIIHLDDPTFVGMDRVRLTSVQVWLDGAQSKTSAPNPVVTLQIENSGSYQDRRSGKEYRFTAAPLRRLFQYHLGSNEVIVPGTVADEQQFAYFAPTPFSEWSVDTSVSHGSEASLNQDINLSSVTAIRMEFEGSIISNLS
ncbi:MAG TPA: hypothetical protein VLL54_01655 [Pyrinomonadaceae bacterium]|nr:hypothetical protein [Pyrinomonadaceae bacterium]